MSQEKKQSSRRNKIIAVILLALLAAAAVTGVVAAKYISDNQRKAEIHASEFHFSSDCLEIGGGTLDVSDWDTKEIVFRLYNYEKENVAQISGVAIGYKIMVPNGWEINSVKTEQGTWVNAAGGVYTMAKRGDRSAHIVTMRYVGDGQPDSATVTVATVSPYEKTLEGTFRISTKSDPTFTVEDQGSAVRLTIYSNNYAGQIRVQWPQGQASPDNVNADVDMSAWSNDNASVGEVFTAEAHHTYTLYFMKKNDTANLEFTVEKEN